MRFRLALKIGYIKIVVGVVNCLKFKVLLLSKRFRYLTQLAMISYSTNHNPEELAELVLWCWMVQYPATSPY